MSREVEKKVRRQVFTFDSDWKRDRATNSEGNDYSQSNVLKGIQETASLPGIEILGNKRVNEVGDTKYIFDIFQETKEGYQNLSRLSVYTKQQFYREDDPNVRRLEQLATSTLSNVNEAALSNPKLSQKVVVGALIVGSIVAGIGLVASGALEEKKPNEEDKTPHQQYEDYREQEYIEQNRGGINGYYDEEVNTYVTRR